MIENGQTKDRELRELEEELSEMKDLHTSLWETYGSELCAGDMSNKERVLEDKINKIKRRMNMQKLKLADDLLIPLIEGNSDKRVTIRKGYREIKLDKLLFEGANDESLQHEVNVTEVSHLYITQAPVEAWMADGFLSWSNFFEGMKKFYPDLDLNSEITIIKFH